MICEWCDSAKYYERGLKHDLAIKLHQQCEGGCECLHQDGPDKSEASSEER